MKKLIVGIYNSFFIAPSLTYILDKKKKKKFTKTTHSRYPIGSLSTGRIVLKFCEKCEGRYKLIFVKKENLIDIRKDKRSYCEVYLDREAKSSFVS
jgi:hypothetical protein